MTDQDPSPDNEEEEEEEEEEDAERRRRKKNGKRMKATVTNVSSYCLGIAVARGLDNLTAETEAERRKLRAQWARVDDRKPNASPGCWQKARDLLSSAGVYKSQHYDMGDVRKIQAHLSGYVQIVVINDDHDGQPIYTGKFVDRRLIIGLLYSEGHFEYIYSIPAFLGCKFYCTLCNKRGADERLHYTCPLKCRLCLSDNCDTNGPEEIQCLKCSVRFELNDCYRRHLQRGPLGGRSRCEKTVKCGKCGVVYYIDHGIKHICGMRFCQACRQMRQPDHTHFLCQRPLSKIFSQKRLYFDLETMPVEDSEGNLKHQVVLACALRCCPSCRKTIPNNRAAALELTCKKCSPDGKRYWEFGIEGNDVLGQFGKWLFNKRHETFSIIAHNLKGFDGQLLVQYLLRPTIPKPKMMIMNGKKINFMSIAGMRVLDSFSFVPFALRKFNTAFEIDELKKGDFPFGFIKPENFDYRGRLPDRKYYGYEQKSLQAKEEFDRFYNEQSQKPGYVFDFRQEIKEYCYADVALLAMGMTKFEETFYEKTSVMLFEETVTAAAAAMLVYQRKFVQPDTIALDMDASSPRIKQSAIARRYLAYRQTLTTAQIQSVDNIGEYKIPGTNYHVDGFIPPTDSSSRGKAIEVYGCYYHACTCSYAPNQIGPDGLKAIDIRRRDMKRASIIRKHCDLEIVWECEIRRQAGTNKLLATMLQCNTAPGTVVCREGLFGGRTEPIRLFFTRGNNKKLYYLDFTSLYPYVMKCCEYPVGQPIRRNSAQFTCPITTPKELLDQCRGYVSCKVLAPTNLFLPVLPYRADKLLFTLCRSEAPRQRIFSIAPLSECAEESNQEVCDHTDDERALYGTWTTVELAVALRHGYRIECVYGAVHWDEWSTELFTGYINTFLKEKQEASGIPRHCQTEEDIQAYIESYRQHEGIELDRRSLSRKDEVIRNIAKLLLNSLWGKFGQRVDVVSSRVLTSAAELFRVLNDTTVEITHVDIVNDSAVLIHTRPVSGTLQPLPTSALPYAIFTTSHARVKLYEAISSVPRPEENLLYMDTDSVIFAADAGGPNPLKDMCGDYLGQLTDELKGEMTDFVTIGAKSYAYRERDSSGRVTTKVKAKGFPMTSDAEEKINFELMLDQVKARLRGDDDAPFVTVYYDCIQRTAGHCLINKRMSKEFRFTFDKRVIRADGGTVPFGFRFI